MNTWQVVFSQKKFAFFFLENKRAFYLLVGLIFWSKRPNLPEVQIWGFRLFVSIITKYLCKPLHVS